MYQEKDSSSSSAENVQKEPSEAPKEATEGEQIESMAEELEKLKTVLADEQKKADAYLNKLRYLQADFENYRKRAQRETEEAAQFNKEKLILSLLSILDELELAVQAGEKTENKDALIVGVKVTLKKLYDLLKNEGVATIEAAGKPFDPRLHEVVSTVPRQDCRTPSIIEEVRKGFTIKGKVIRPSVVTVATPVNPMQVKEEKVTSLKVVEEDEHMKVKEKSTVVKKVKENE